MAVVSKDCDFFDRPPLSMVKELAADVPVRMDMLRRLPGFERAEDHVGRANGFATALLIAAVTVPSMAGYLEDELNRSLAAGGVAARWLVGAIGIE